VTEEEETTPFTLHSYFRSHSGQRRLSRFPSLIRSALRIVWRAAPGDLVACAVLQVVSGAAVAVQLLVVRRLLSRLIGGDPSFGSVVPEVVALAVVGVVVGMLRAVLNARQQILAQLVLRHTYDGMARTASGVDLIAYDSPAFHDRLQRAQSSAGSRPTQMTTALIGVAGAATSIAGVVVALLVIQPLFCLLVLVAYLPTWIAANQASRLYYAYTVEQTERERLRTYLYQLLTMKLTAQEVRAFELGDFLAGRQRTVFDQLIAELRHVLRRRLRIALAGQALTGLLTGGALAILVVFVTSGRMSLSEAGAAAGGMVLLTGRLQGLATSAGGLYESSLYLEDFSTFVEAASRIEAARPTRRAPADPQEVSAQGLRFTYPSRSEPSIDNISITWRRGEVIALVGENGSGKTTLAKLLGGLYSPATGTITWDGEDAALLDPASIRRNVAVIFQDFTRYMMSAYDNVALGDSERFADVRAVERAAAAAGMHDTLSALPHGYETILGPEFIGGSDLSGGQWQRVALARAFFRDSPFIILDEPTASLDPRAEADLYASIGGLFAGRGVLLISHRFGSVRTADRIYVLRDGRVHESGSHTDLMAADGYYAELFRLQSSLYRE
jgi:ATP-binding cassette subfamily B protein